MTAEGGLMASKAWLELEASSALAVVSTGPAAPGENLFGDKVHGGISLAVFNEE